jgi:hypothetical protein
MGGDGQEIPVSGDGVAKPGAVEGVAAEELGGLGPGAAVAFEAVDAARTTYRKSVSWSTYKERVRMNI